MNIAIFEVCIQASDAKRGKIEIKPAIPFVSESTVEPEHTAKIKDEFISATCKYIPSAEDSKKHNYVIQAKDIKTGTTEDALHCYISIEDF